MFHAKVFTPRLLATRGAGGGPKNPSSGGCAGCAAESGLARVAANHFAGCVEEIESDRVVRRAEPVLHDHACRRILSRRMDRSILGRHLRRRSAAAAAATAESTAGRQPILIARLEQVRALGLDRRRHLLERRDVVHDVEAATVRGEHDVAFLEDEVVHRDDRQVEPQAFASSRRRQREYQTPRSVPATSRPRLLGSSRTTRVNSVALMPASMRVQCAPQSDVFHRYGLSSSS